MNSRRARRRQRTRAHRARERVRTAMNKVIRDLLPLLTKYKTPVSRINLGFCEDVAHGLQAELDRLGIPNLIVIDDDTLHGTRNEIFTDGGWSHAWIFSGGYHYDSEARAGVRRWRDLPHFRRWTQGPRDELVGDVVILPKYAQGPETQVLLRNAGLRRQDIREGLGVEDWLPKWMIEREIEFDNWDDPWRGPLW